MDPGVELLLILLAAVGLRGLSMLAGSSDNMVHLWNVRLRRHWGDFTTHRTFDAVNEGARGYPTLTHGVVAWFPRPWWPTLGAWLNTFWDLCLLTMVYVTAGILVHGRIGPLSVGGAVAMLTATCPLLVPVNSRIRSMGGRTFGGLVCFMYTAVIGFGLHADPWIALTFCTAMGLLIVASSQFAIQVFVVLSLFLSVVYLHWLPIAALGLTALIAWFIPSLGLRDVLRFRKAHIQWYWRNQRSRGLATGGRNRLVEHLTLPWLCIRRPARALYLVMQDSSLFGVLIPLPMLPVLIVLVLVHGDLPAMLADPSLRYCLMVVAAMGLAFVLTSLPWLLLFGQAERYFEYAVPFLATLFVWQIARTGAGPEWLLGMVVAQIAICLLLAAFAIQDGRRARKGHGDDGPRGELREFLAAADPHRILTVPIKDAFEMACWADEDHRFYYRCIVLPDDRTGFGYMDEDCATLQFPRADLDHFAERYGVDWVIVEKRQLAAAGRMGIDYRLAERPTVWENEAYAVVALTGQGGDDVA